MTTGAELIREIDACRVPRGGCAFWWLGQHGFAVKLGQAVCYLDPFLSEMKSRQVPPLLRPEEITDATLVLGSHDHVDHIDRKVWPGIAAASPGAKFVVPKLLRERIVREVGLSDARVLGVDEGVTVREGGVSVTAVPAAHEFLDADPATSLHPYVGFVLEAGGFRLYHAGDTCLYEGIHARLRQWPLNLAMLPINGRDARRLERNCIGNMTYQEAADLAGSIAPGLTVPAHFEMFAGNSEDPQLFADYMRVKYPALRTFIPRHGQCVVVEPGGR
ncbi:MAG TPA: MBL fold metallo-hydrolase [Phycisphaerales bacterium]|nr:MBL fold metallo-hydrolase [Phycisphaerales bacterium]